MPFIDLTPYLRRLTNEEIHAWGKLSVRTQNILAANGLTVEQAKELTDCEIYRIGGGKRTIQEIRSAK